MRNVLLALGGCLARPILPRLHGVALALLAAAWVLLLLEMAYLVRAWEYQQEGELGLQLDLTFRGAGWLLLAFSLGTGGGGLLGLQHYLHSDPAWQLGLGPRRAGPGRTSHQAGLAGTGG